jgi:hypothetical protein
MGCGLRVGLSRYSSFDYYTVVDKVKRGHLHNMRQSCFLKQSINDPYSQIDELLTVNFHSLYPRIQELALGLYCMLTKRRPPFTEEANCFKFTAS